MTIAILETGYPPRRFISEFGGYPDMFRALLGAERLGAVFDVTKGAFPEHPEAYGAYLVTGSPAGVYDDLPWIEALKTFLLEARGKARLAGICFGHQIMADTFGGRVAKSDKGWGIGQQDYRIEPTELTGEATRVTIPVCHQDQVIAAPPQARVIGGNDFCPIGALLYEDQPALSFQFHPEFEPAYVAGLIDLIGDEIADPEAARASLDKPSHRQQVGEWIATFLDG